MNRFSKIIIFIFLLILVYFISTSAIKKSDVTPEIVSTPSVEKEINTELTASFEIYTNGTKRIFSDKRYHDLSKDVYIQSNNPSIIHIKKSGTTWNDFFKTLPMKLTADCLTTGTGQLFCSGENGNLKFFINDQENPDALNSIIQQNDKLMVTFK